MRHIVILLSLILSLTAHAQDEIFDTAKRVDPHSSNLSNLNRNFNFKEPTDSAMLFFSQYNKVKKENVAIQDLGDIGTPYLNLMFKPASQPGFITGFNPYGDYYFYNKNAKFYRAKVPYTYFYYTQGKAGQSGRGLISFDATHTQNIGERFNFAVNYHSTTNEGFYRRNTNVMKNIQGTLYYKSKSQRYMASAILTWNKAIFNENGGIEQSAKNDLYFRNLQTNRLVDVELLNAKNINRYRDHQFNQTLWLKGKYTKDSLKQFIPQIGIGHIVHFEKQANYYTDNARDFNSHIYDSVYIFNALMSADSMGYSNISNSFEIFSPLKEKGLSFIAGTKYEKINYYQQVVNNRNSSRNINFNTSIYGQLNFNFLKAFESELKGNFFLAGYNQADHYLHWKNEALLFGSKGYIVKIDALSIATQPTYQQQYMFSNHYVWDNSFKQQGSQTLSFGLSKKIKRPGIYDARYYALPPESFNLRLNYTLLSNYIYYGFDAKPHQMATAENILQLYAKKHFNLKKLQIHQELVYQTFSSGLKSKILLPQLLSKTGIYLQFYAFKKATFMQVGIDVNYTSEYTAKFYNPSTRNFQLSNVKVGNYPYADFFVNAEIKTARIFFKMEHFNQDFGNPNLFPNYFYSSPYQPTALRRFRLGVAWKFYY